MSARNLVSALIVTAFAVRAEAAEQPDRALVESIVAEWLDEVDPDGSYNSGRTLFAIVPGTPGSIDIEVRGRKVIVIGRPVPVTDVTRQVGIYDLDVKGYRATASVGAIEAQVLSCAVALKAGQTWRTELSFGNVDFIGTVTSDDAPAIIAAFCKNSSFLPEAQ